MRHLYYSALWILLILGGCQLNPFRDVNWQTELVAPLAFTEVSIWDAITDSSIFETRGDNVLSLVYRDTVVSLQIRDLVEIPDTTNSYSVSLDALTLDSDTITQRITLGEFARQLAQSSDPNTAQIGLIILANQGNTLPFLPAFTGQSSDTISIDASAFFESAVLDEGELVLTIDNQFPVGLRNVIFRISNANLGTDIVRDTFPTIPSKTSVTESYDLAGQEIESSLEGQLENLDVDGGLFIPIDTLDYIEIKLVARNLKARTATAIFPGQTIVDTLAERTYQFSGDLSELSLTKLVVRSGQIRADAQSTVEDSIAFIYELPTALDNDGNIPSVLVKLPPATPGGISTKSETFQLGGFTLDLTGEQGDLFNTLVERIAVSLLFSGNLVTLDKNDSVNVDFTLESLEPIYVEGYIGQTTLSFEGQEAIDLFDEIDVDRIKFSEAEAEISFANSIGLPSEVLVQEFSATNSRTGTQVRLANSNLVAGPLKVPGPELPDTNEVVTTQLSLTPSNSNINTFISSLADEVSYNLSLTTNPGDAVRFDNFITENSAMDVLFDFKLPLVGIVDELVFSDTTDFSSQAVELENIESGGLTLVIENQFPLELIITASVYDENWGLIRTLVQDGVVEAGTVEPSGRVEVAAQSLIEQEFSLEELNDLLENGRNLVFGFRLNTRPEDTDVGIYSDYTVKAKLVGDFEYQLSN